jgi:hypothetical protein
MTSRSLIPALTLSLLASVSCIGCSSAKGEAAPAVRTGPVHQYIVGIDISSSRLPHQLDESRRLLDGVIGRMQNGDELVLVEMYQGANIEAREWRDSIPAFRFAGKETPSDKRRATDFRDIARTVAGTFFDPSRVPKIRGTDVLFTLGRAADYARGAKSRRPVVLLLSDMVQQASGVDMMRAGGVPRTGWVSGRKAQGLLPALGGTCVVVVGADVSTPRGAEIRRFWKEYLNASGTRFDDQGGYLSMMSDPAQVECPEGESRR